MKQMLILFVILLPLAFSVSGCGRSSRPEPPPSRSPEEMDRDMKKMNASSPGGAPPAAAKK